jgi:membrane associated rhomboid family serine protease
MGSMPLGFPEFKGATRRLLLLNLISFFGLLVLGFASPTTARLIFRLFSFIPETFLHGYLWQPITYSFIHAGLLQTLFELLSLWFLLGFLETYRDSSWVTSLYAASVIGTAITAAAIYQIADRFSSTFAGPGNVLFGCFGGIFGLLVAIGVLFGDVEFMMFFVINIKAKYLAAIYALIAFAMLFGQSRLYAFSQLGGALAGLLFIRFAPRKGYSFAASEWLYGLRNRYYRWKRRRAGRKFEVYMKKQGRTVRLDNRGRQIEDDEHNDRSRWN